MVGETGFEPATLCSQSTRETNEISAARVNRGESRANGINGLQIDCKPRRSGPAFLESEPSPAEQGRLRQCLGAAHPDAGYTYFAGPAGGFLIKIGRSCEPYRRARELSREVCHPIRVLATVRGDFEVEYHRLFAAHRAFDEWFEPHPDILAEIDRLQAVTDASLPSPAREVSNPSTRLAA